MDLTWTESIDGVDWDELAALYRAAPLGDKDPASLQTAFGNSLYVCLVREAGRLVGAGRVVGDGVDVAYIADVALLPSHQGRGLGKRIMQHLLARSAGHNKRILYAVPGKEDFYRAFGFARMTTAMAIFPDQAGARARGVIE